MKRLIYAGIISIIATSVSFFIPSASAIRFMDTFGGPSTETVRRSTEKSDDEAHPCLHFSNHEYEVCTAYVANSSIAVLVPFYKYSKTSDSPSLQRYVVYRLGSRYDNQAYTTMKNRVADWPDGKFDVNVPRIKIISVKSDLPSNTASIVTSETWKVTDKNDSVVYQETNQRHSVTMRRVQSYVLHKWVVVDIK